MVVGISLTNPIAATMMPANSDSNDHLPVEAETAQSVQSQAEPDEY